MPAVDVRERGVICAVYESYENEKYPIYFNAYRLVNLFFRFCKYDIGM